jgi:GMP synthase-like glutamine amidotransferase
VEILSLVHEDDARSGVFADAIAAAGARLEEASYAFGDPPARDPLSYDAVVVLGGAMHVDQTDRHPWLDTERRLIAELIEARKPLLGVCLGSQLVAQVAGAEVGPLPGGLEIGWHEVELDPSASADPVLGALPRRFSAFQWHEYGVLGDGAVTKLAVNDAGLQAFRVGDAPAWGIQFHAEVDAPTVAGWLSHYAEPEIDAAAISGRSKREMPRWNELGRELCGAFVRAASTVAP